MCGKTCLKFKGTPPPAPYGHYATEFSFCYVSLTFFIACKDQCSKNVANIEEFLVCCFLLYLFDFFPQLKMLSSQRTLVCLFCI